MNPTLRIATRQSPLALWQAEHIAARLRVLHPGLTVELVRMTTRGDQIIDRPLAKIGGKGLFIKGLEDAMLRGEADLAVHSAKDLPAEMEPGFHLAVICAPADPRDALVGDGTALHALPPGARIGTSSLRRQCQLRALRPDLQIGFVRGNLGTRLGRLDKGDFDALVLAAAGLDRLGLAARISERLAPHELLPAVGQGVLGIETRAGDAAVEQLLAPLADQPTTTRLRAERAFSARLDGSCETPLAVHATLHDTRIHLAGLVGLPDGTRVLRAALEGPAAEPEALGTALAQELLAQGAEEILTYVRSQSRD